MNTVIRRKTLGIESRGSRLIILEKWFHCTVAPLVRGFSAVSSVSRGFPG
jgi:hypothetical protein